MEAPLKQLFLEELKHLARDHSLSGGALGSKVILAAAPYPGAACHCGTGMSRGQHRKGGAGSLCLCLLSLVKGKGVNSVIVNSIRRGLADLVRILTLGLPSCVTLARLLTFFALSLFNDEIGS